MTKLRIALDSETTEHASLESSRTNLDKSPTHERSSQESIRFTSDTSLLLQTKAPTTTSSQSNISVLSTDANRNKFNSEHEMARKAFLIGQSEERVQALSVLMLHLCTGLQYAQCVALN